MVYNVKAMVFPTHVTKETAFSTLNGNVSCEKQNPNMKKIYGEENHFYMNRTK